MANRSFTARHALGSAALALLAGCGVPPPPPPPPPAPVMRLPVAPPAPPPMARDWRDAALTPGDWHWAGGIAWYGTATPVLTLRCTRPGAELSMQIASSGGAPGPLIASVTTTALLGPASGTRLADGSAVLRFAVRDPLLDAMAFSRGRFMIAAEGVAPVIVPSWPEVSRAIEACRTAG